jgi:hypothetical protein
MNSQTAITLARKHVGNGAAMESSARLNLEAAVILHEKCENEYAKARAIKSLAYSVGVFHADYQKAAA